MAHLAVSEGLLEQDRAAMKSILDYRRIERAIRFLDAHVVDQPSLEDVAREIGLSPFHAQRLFTRWAGISPKRFLGLLTVGHAKVALQAGESVLDATYEVGLSGPSRLHDLFVTYEAMTPGEYKQQGSGLVIRYGVHPTPFGAALLLTTERGIAGLSFVDGAPEEAIDEARAAWPLSRLVEDRDATGALVARLFDGAGGEPTRLLLRGTNFQVKVWSALLRVPSGRVVSYLDLGDRPRPARRRARRRQRSRAQPGRLRRALPPGDPGDRRARRLPLGHRPAPCAARLGSGADRGGRLKPRWRRARQCCEVLLDGLAVQLQIEAVALDLDADPQADREVDHLEQHERHQPAPDDRGQHAKDLGQDLAGIAFEEPGRAADRLDGEHARRAGRRRCRPCRGCRKHRGHRRSRAHA